ncbi:hypothetical protein [Paenibacillus polymyxa]|uniref:hypothetical protein n=1 Tax=Paenibacillus polymyxa TaxID=1406 RepID=UPI001378DDE5|nr:hypothetical protein [Paenibacillus polymyxa]
MYHEKRGLKYLMNRRLTYYIDFCLSTLFYVVALVYLVLSVVSIWINVLTGLTITTGFVSILLTTFDYFKSSYKISKRELNKFEKVLSGISMIIVVLLILFITIYVPIELYDVPEKILTEKFGKLMNAITYATLTIAFISKGLETRTKYS